MSRHHTAAPIRHSHARVTAVLTTQACGSVARLTCLANSTIMLLYDATLGFHYAKLRPQHSEQLCKFGRGRQAKTQQHAPYLPRYRPQPEPTQPRLCHHLNDQHSLASRPTHANKQAASMTPQHQCRRGQPMNILPTFDPHHREKCELTCSTPTPPSPARQCPDCLTAWPLSCATPMVTASLAAAPGPCLSFTYRMRDFCLLVGCICTARLYRGNEVNAR
jgi:hypothetical protein